MRLHRLQVTAFGPFADQVRVDFDALGADGLFLLHGATGAGKTSLLDAVAFALYGQVPGHRHGSPLRSHLAPAEAEPQVICEFSCGERRFEVSRSPTWDRPKRRGSGTTTQQAAVRVRESVDGGWLVRATRLDEAGLLLGDVLGMDREQFTKVVLLPQGDFAAFLHAPSDKRRDLLQKLFGTERFEVVEAFLAEQRRELARQVTEAEHQRAQLLSAMVADWQSVRDLLPPELDAAAVDPDWVIGEVAAGRGPAALVAAAQDALHQAQEREQAAHRSFTTAQQDRDLVSRFLTVQTEVRGLEAGLPGLARDQDRLALARKAAGTAGHLDALQRNEAEVAQASRDLRESVESVAPLVSAPTLPGLGAEAGGVPNEMELAEASALRRKELGHLDSLLGLESSSVNWQADLARTGSLQTQRHGELEVLRAERTADSGALVTARTELAVAGKVAALVPERAQAVDRAAARFQAAADVTAIAERLAHAEDARRDATDAAQRARGEALDLTARRLEGMAAELAEGLADGQDCPVCGSTEHPAPAVTVTDRVTAAQERQARDLADAAQLEVDRIQAQLVLHGTRLATAREASGGLELQQAQLHLEQAREAHQVAVVAAATESRLTTAVSQLESSLLQRESAEQALLDDLQQLGRRQTQLETLLTDARTRLHAAQGEDPSIWARHDRLSTEAKLLDSARDAVARHGQALQALRRSRKSAQTVCRRAGFADVAGAAAALLDEQELSDLQVQVTATEQALVAGHARLGAPEFGALCRRAEHEHVSLTPFEAAVKQAAAVLSAAEQANTAADRRLDRLQRVTTALADRRAQLDAHQASTEPLRAEHAVVAELSACVEGGRGSNTLRMRLSAYVLAAQLDRVAAAASDRLSVMSAGRYTLVHTRDQQGRGMRSGLGLAVLDSWVGTERDPASLSGGETFLASLALALGLADVVQHEAGGVTIETLFVDEGFGSLDEESLELVMEVLDGLREGGRAIGIVSHVAELRHRITSRLEVVRAEHGSTVRQFI